MVAVSGKWLAAALYAVSAAASYPASPNEHWKSALSGCNVSSVSIPLPSSQNTLVAPTNLPTSFTAVGVGVQNYTCSSANNYTFLGAVAELFDISCLYGTDLFNTIQQPLYAAWTNTTSNVTVQDFIHFFPLIFASDLILGQHYYVPNPAGSGISPKWDFRATERFEGVGDAFFIGKPNVTLADPFNPHVDVPWVKLDLVAGKLAKEVYRIKTLGGQSPTSCTYGSSPDISVKYTAQYWLFGTPNLHRSSDLVTSHTSSN